MSTDDAYSAAYDNTTTTTSTTPEYDNSSLDIRHGELKSDILDFT